MVLLNASFGKCLLELQENFTFSEDQISDIKEFFLCSLHSLPGISGLSVFNLGGFLSLGFLFLFLPSILFLIPFLKKKRITGFYDFTRVISLLTALHGQCYKYLRMNNKPLI